MPFGAEDGDIQSIYDAGPNFLGTLSFDAVWDLQIASTVDDQNYLARPLALILLQMWMPRAKYPRRHQRSFVLRCPQQSQRSFLFEYAIYSQVGLHILH